MCYNHNVLDFNAMLERCLSVDVCYNKLFKLLIDKDMKKKDLRKMTGISPNTLTKLSSMHLFQWKCWLRFVEF